MLGIGFVSLCDGIVVGNVLLRALDPPGCALKFVSAMTGLETKDVRMKKTINDDLLSVITVVTNVIKAGTSETHM